MPAFETPQPIDLAIDLPVGLIEVIATERGDTVVTVSPTNPASAADRRGAEQTRVEFDGRRVVVDGPRPRFSFIGPSESVDVKIELPTGSRLAAELSVGSVRTTGRLGATRVKASTGAVDLDAVGDLWVRAGHGGVVVASADGPAEIVADHGQIRVGTFADGGIVTASHGSITIDESSGDVEAKLSYGDLDLRRALGSVTAKTAYGSIQIGEVSSGAIRVESGYGRVEVGVRAGVAVWADLASREGRVRNELEGDRAPAPTEDSVAIRARATYGDVAIHRVK